MLTQIHTEDWQPLLAPLHLCTLPLGPGEVVSQYMLEFESFPDGAGITDHAAVSVDGHGVLLKSPMSPPDGARQIEVWVAAHETAWDPIVDALCEALELSRDDLPFVESGLVPGQWILWRLDDNGNEAEMFRLPDRARAEFYKQVYERRGHKQAYAVRRAG